MPRKAFLATVDAGLMTPDLVVLVDIRTFSISLLFPTSFLAALRIVK
jgi:hypothetical protein